MTSQRSSKHLYELWRSTAARFSSELALVDFAIGRRWTFGELCAESERGAAPASVAFPQGHSPDFIFALLRAWREGTPTCPIEPSQIALEFECPPVPFAHLKLTSASTGAAKCIAFTPEQLAADAQNIVSTMGLRPDWPNLASISLAHSYGFSNFILPLLLHGIPLGIVPAPLPQTILRAAEMFSEITLAAVPALWRSWHEANSIPPNVKLAISAGAPLPIELEQEVHASRGLKIHNFYGSSECGGIAYDRSPLPRDAADLGYAGTALDNVSVSLSDANTLVVESAAVGETYWPVSHSSLRAPRFETADLAEIRGGKICLRGRASDLINVAGRKVAPETIEAALRKHPLVKECVVFGIPSPSEDRLDTVTACVSTTEKIEIGDLALFLSDKLPPWQIPRRWWFTDDLLPNQRGKISRTEWRKRLLDRTWLS